MNHIIIIWIYDKHQLTYERQKSAILAQSYMPDLDLHSFIPDCEDRHALITFLQVSVEYE